MKKPLNLPLACFLILFRPLAVACVGGMAVVSLRQQIADSARRLEKSENEVIRLERLSEELRAKIAMFESPEALKIVANRMGMVPAKLSQYHLMEEADTATKIVSGKANPTKAYASSGL